MTYFTAKERREALLKWLRHEGPGEMFNTAEVQMGAVDIFTPLYSLGDARRCGRDLSLLKKEGHLERVGSQWRMV